MRKITNLLLVLMLLGSILSVAFAVQADEDDQGTTQDEDQDEQNNTTNMPRGHHYGNDTEREVGIMNNSLGARIRLLQLEKALLTNILKGVMTVQVLKGLNVTTTELEHILGNLSEVLENVRAADPAANDSVQVFVELKNESKNLTKQFRDTLRLLLDNETIAMIKEQLKNITSDELQNCSMRLRHWIRQFNMNQLYRLYGIIGETNTSMINEYINGNISLDLVKLQLRKMVNQMAQEKRHMIFSEIKEDNIKKKIHTQKMLEDMEHHGNGNGHGQPY
ncbi:MAG: hypothetical protein MUC80_04830 [Candidatus Thermoplasmatota archaeon]|jgi:hypothetical protein|nr:hypothetical protein [Candidatus Thermoplasmatota archaeon]